MPFHLKLKSIQNNAYLAINGAIRGASKEKFSQELSLESLQSQCCVVNYSIMQLTSDELMCFNASCVESN